MPYPLFRFLENLPIGAPVQNKVLMGIRLKNRLQAEGLRLKKNNSLKETSAYGL